MRRSCAILLVLVMLTALLASCTDGGTPAGGTPGATATPQPTPISYTGADFSGKWAVSALYDSSGKALSADEIAQAGANFSLELLEDGLYFVYDAQGAPIGQGTYSVSQQELTFSASGAQTVYAIESIDTLRCEAEDGSVTVMARVAEPEEELMEPEGGDTAETDTAETDTAETDTAETGAPDPDMEETDMDEPLTDG